jgi:hypothetical protein
MLQPQVRDVKTSIKSDTKNFYAALSFPIIDSLLGESSVISGAFRALANDVLTSSQPITFLCPNHSRSPSEQLRLPEWIQMEAIQSEIEYSDERLSHWFGSGTSPGGLWQAVHLASFSQYFPTTVLERLYQDANITPTHEPLQDFGRYLDRVMANSAIQLVERQFFAGWHTAFEQIPAEATLLLEGYTAIGLVRCSRPEIMRLRARGVRVILRLREGVSEHWTTFEMGREILRAISTVTQVAVHTDYFREQLLRQLEALHLPIPEIVTYYSGIDHHSVAHWAETITPANFAEVIPGFDQLQAEQQALITDAMRTRHSIPHRFLVADGCDGIKGLWQTLEAIRLFLAQESERGMSRETMQQRYRFYLVQYMQRHSGQSPSSMTNINQLYADCCNNQRLELSSLYPGVIFTCTALRGRSAAALYGIMPFTNQLSGSTGDGLHLLSQESAYANNCLNAPTGTILGANAGFARQTQREGGGDLAWFPASGSPEALCQAMRAVVECSETNPTRLVQTNARLVDRHICSRQASLFDL